MALWNRTGSRPKGISKQDNRNTVVTDRGFERNIVAGTRVKREILVPLNDLTTTFPKPGVTDVWHVPAEATVELTQLSGTVATVASNTTVTGTQTKFQTELSVNQKIRIGPSTYATVASIASNTSLDVSVALAANTTGSSIYKMSVPNVTTKISFAEPLSMAGPAKITINNVTHGGTINAVAPVPTTGDNILSYVWTPTYPGEYTISTQTIANNTATAINLRSSNADTETANTVISTSMATAAGTFTLRNV